MGAPATLPADFNGWDAPATSAPPATLPANFSGWDKPPLASVGERLRENFLSGVGVTNDEGAKNFFEHPINTLMNALDAQGQLAVKAKEAYKNGDYKGALMYGLNYLAPFIGPQTAKAGEQLNEGDIAGGIARSAGAAVPILAASPEARAAAGSAVSPLKPAIAATARAASDIIDPEVTGMISPRLAAVQRNLGRLASALDKSQKAHATVAASDNAVFPGANLPAAPEAATLQASALEHPGAPPPPPPEAALGTVPVRQLRDLGSEAPPPSIVRLPGQIAPEMVRPRAFYGGPAVPPIPARQGLMLPGEVAPPEPVPPTPPETQPVLSAASTVPRTLSGESALRQLLGGQDNANLLKIAKSRGINVTKESQLKPGVSDPLLINKIVNDFSDDELDNLRSTYLENTRMGKHNFGDIGPEAWKTMSLQTYFPDVKIAGATLKRVGTNIGKNAVIPGDDLTDILQRSLEAAKAQ